jgi:YidC/Oxa1 family membrane protein insertase
MEFFINIYNLFLFQPIFNLLIWLSQNLPGKDFGVAVVLLTVGVRLASYPLGAKGVVAQKKLAELQPKMKEIQEKFKDKREEQSKALRRSFCKFPYL